MNGRPIYVHQRQVEPRGQCKATGNLGQHQSAIGTSTRDRTDREVDQAALEDFTAAWEEIKYGRAVAGREW